MVSMSQHMPGLENRSDAELHPRPATRARADLLGRDGRAILARTVERDVIPQLIAMPWMGAAAALLKQAAGPAAATTPAPVLDGALTERLVTLCLAAESGGVATLVADLSRRGAAADALYLDLLTPAARRLGDMWDNDECSFADVTLGLIRLQNAQRGLAPTFVGIAAPGLNEPRALLMPVPGEQHTFGLSMVRDFFQRAGWDVWLGTAANEAEAVRIVKRDRADLVGLSFACDDRIATAENLISELRRVAANPDLVIMVGGPSFVADPGLAARVGADATAVDGHQAVLLAHKLIHAKAGQT